MLISYLHSLVHQQHLRCLVDCWMCYSFVSCLVAHLQFALQAKLETYRVMIFQRLAGLFWVKLGDIQKPLTAISNVVEWVSLGLPGRIVACSGILRASAGRWGDEEKKIVLVNVPRAEKQSGCQAVGGFSAFRVEVGQCNNSCCDECLRIKTWAKRLLWRVRTGPSSHPQMVELYIGHLLINSYSFFHFFLNTSRKPMPKLA
jgi:hypothetical protein